MFTKTLHAANISCQHCAHAIQKELTPMPGVKSVQVDVEHKLVTVTYDNEQTLAKAEAALAEIGYPADK